MHSSTARWRKPRCRSLVAACLWLSLLFGGFGAAGAQADASARPSQSDTLRLSYLGTAGWQITAGQTVVLVDPYFTRLDRRFFPGPWTITKGGIPLALLSDSAISADTVAIQARLKRADFVLVSHSHFDHLLDVPHIALRTGAKVIGTESTRNIALAYGVADSQLITVRGGEDFDFKAFSLRVIPSLHSALANKLYFDPRVAPITLHPPLRIRDYPEGGTLVFLVRMAGCEIFFSGSMNYIEGEVTGLRPDVAVLGSTGRRREVFDYTGRLIRALGGPALVLPNHWDDETLPFADPNAYGGSTSTPGAVAIRRELDAFAHEVRDAAPGSRVIVPSYFQPLAFLTDARGCRLIDGDG